MIVNFDSLRHIETPEFILCNPGSERIARPVEGGSLTQTDHATKAIGVIPDHSDEEFVFNFNAPSELNFRAYYNPNVRSAGNDNIVHTVVAEDTIDSVAKKYGVSTDAIVDSNKSTYSSISNNMIVPAGYPIITAQPQNYSTTSSGAPTFSVTATGYNLQYKWQYRRAGNNIWEDSEVSGHNTRTVTLSGSSANRNGQAYRCIVSNSVGTVVSDVAYCVITDVAPKIVRQPEDMTVCRGQQYMFHVDAIGGSLTYQWQYKDYSDDSSAWTNVSSAVTGGNTDTMTAQATVTRATLLFRCIVTNSAGSITSDAAKSSNAEGLPIITVHPSNINAAIGDQVSLSITATGNGVDYQWQYSTDNRYSWVNWSGKMDSTVKTAVSLGNDGVYYRCVAFNDYGTVTSSAARIRANNYPRMTIGWNLSIPNQNADTYARRVFTSIQNRRLIFSPGIGYFIITGVTDGYDGHMRYKDVSAQSIEIEIQGHTVPFIPDGTYRFVTDPTIVQPGEDDIGVLNRLLNSLPLWTIGFVESAVASRFRSFTDVDASTNILSFMIDSLQNAYECIFVFDVQNRLINVYDQSHYTQNSGIFISKEDFIDAMDVSENSDDLYTAISVISDNEATISSVNPLGTSVIYRFDHYVDWMTPSLGKKVLQWEDEMNRECGHYISLNRQYYNQLTNLTNLRLELERLNLQKTMYTRCKENITADNSVDYVDSYNDAIVAAGGDEIIASEVAEAISEISSKIYAVNSQISAVDTAINTTEVNANNTLDAINSISNYFSFENYYTEDELNELYNYIFEGQYRDEYVTIIDDMSYDEQFDQMRTLYARAYDVLVKTSEPTQEFNVDVASIIFEKDFEHISDKLHTGYLIDVELLDGEVAKLFLSTMTVNYEDHNFTLTFGNRYNKFDPKSLFENVLGSVSKSANTISNIKGVVSPLGSEMNAMRQAIQNSRDITMGRALEASDEEVVIDQGGYTGRTKLSDGTYDARQVKITGRSIVFTDDAWDTARVAIGEIGGLDGTGEKTTYGINAQYVVGEMIVGNGLVIKDRNRNDIFSVLEGEIATSVSGVASSVNTLSGKVNTLSGTVESYKKDADGKYNQANSSIATMQSTISQLPDQINFSINAAIDGQDSFSPVTGYTFDADGLKIEKTGGVVHNRLDDTGMYVTRTSDDSAVLTANNDGVNAVNLTARNFLIFGTHARFEALPSDTRRVACFYI